MAGASSALLGAGFLVGVGASGLAWWSQPYNAPGLPVALTGVAMAALALISALLVLARAAGAWRVLAVMLGCVPAAVVLRVLLETWQDPSSHNLWPFEVVFGLLLGMPAVAMGTAAGALVLSLSDRRG